MVLLLSALFLPALASTTPSAGYLLPGAATPDSDVHVGGELGVGGVGVCAEGCGGLAFVRAGAWAALGPSNRFAGRIDVVSFVAGDVATTARPLILASARYTVVDEERFQLAPWLGIASDPFGAVFTGGTRDIYAAGVAFEYGGPRVRLDASVPLVVLPNDEPGRLYADGDLSTLTAVVVGASDVGLRVNTGKGHSFRFAKTGPVPEVQYRYDAGPVWFDAGLGVWLLLNDVHVAVGGRF